MAQSVIGALRANLGLDSAKFSKGAKKAKEPMARLKSDLKKITAIATAAGAALTAFALSGAQEIDEAAKASRRLGASVAGFRGLELAASEAGVNLSSLTSDIQTLDREIASIGISGNGARALKELGLTVEDLVGLDADEKIARIADQVQNLGLSTGKTTAILRDLGVRNREMVLLVSQGGAAIREARKDIEDYGLALSRPDATRIEQANDAIARLGIVGRYIGQRLALQIVPALGDMAESLTDAMRAGGQLRTVIDFLVDNLGRLTTYLGTFITILGGRFVGAMVAAKLATMNLAGALAFLRGALIRTGIGALVVGAGELVYWFTRLIGSAESFSEGLDRVFSVGKAVFDGLWKTAWGMSEILAGVASSIVGSFVRAFAEIAKAWDALANGMAKTWNIFAESSLGESIGLRALGISDVSGWIGEGADALFDQAVSSIKTGGQRIADAGKDVADAFKNSIAPLKLNVEGMDDGKAAAEGLADALNSLPDAAEIAAQGVGKAKGKVSELSKSIESVKRTARSAFADLVTGAKSMREALSTVFDAIARRFAEMAFDDMFSGLFGGSKSTGGGWLSGIGKLLGFANGTNSAPGGLAMVGERGQELVNLPQGSRVHTAQETRNMLRGAGGNGLLRIELGEGLVGSMIGEMEGMAIQLVQDGISEYDSKVMPGRVNEITADPLAV
ncbi:MAG: hypothetical protein ACU0AU_04875 [Cognatishimia activa]